MIQALEHHLAELANGALCYLIFIGILYLCVFAVGSLFLGCKNIFDADPFMDRYFRQVERLAAFLAVLLVVGDFYGAVWNTAVRGHFYSGGGFAGVDFIPWMPVTHALMNPALVASSERLLLGVTFGQLQLAWVIFASATWMTTLLIYLKISPEPFCEKRHGHR